MLLHHFARSIWPVHLIGFLTRNITAFAVTSSFSARDRATLGLMVLRTCVVALVQERLGHRLSQVAGIKLLDPPVRNEPSSLLSVWHPSRSSDSGLVWLRRLLWDVASQIAEPLSESVPGKACFESHKSPLPSTAIKEA